MPWEYLLSGVSGVGIALVFTLIFIKKVVEKSVDSQFELRLESYKSEQSKALESQKAELDIWATLRKDILTEVWDAHRSIVKSMGNVLKTVQEPFALVSYYEMESTLKNLDKRSEIVKRLNESIKQFRDINHSTIDLISDEAGNICQKFFDEAFELSVMLSSPLKTDKSKAINLSEVVQDLAKEFISMKTKVNITREETVNKLSKLMGKTEAPIFLPKIAALKDQRKAFYKYIVSYFGLEEIMPWMLRSNGDRKV